MARPGRAGLPKQFKPLPVSQRNKFCVWWSWLMGGSGSQGKEGTPRTTGLGHNFLDMLLLYHRQLSDFGVKTLQA